MQTPVTVSQTTLEWYNDLGAWRDADFNSGSFILLTLLDALGSQLDTTEQYTRDDDTHVGWGQLLDVNACPAQALSWLAQFPGVSLPVGLSTSQQRDMIRSQPNMRRGTVDVIRAAAQALLTGTQRVDIIERTPDAYSFEVITYTAETPDSTAVRNALVAAKPGGLVMTYNVQAGPTIDELIGTINAQNPAPTGTIDNYATNVPG